MLALEGQLDGHSRCRTSFRNCFRRPRVQRRRALRGEKHLPMQWWLTGELTWSARRGSALAFIPPLAMCVFATCVVLALNVLTAAGQEGMFLPSLFAINVIFMSIQLFYL